MADLRRLITFLLAIAWIAAPTHCLEARAAAGGTAAICAAAATALPEGPGPAVAPGHGMTDACPVCAGLGAADLPDPVRLPDLRLTASPAPVPSAAPAAAPRRLAHPGTPRAPPRA